MILKEIIDKIEHMLIKEFEVHEKIDIDEPLIMYGIDSLNYIKALTEIEKIFEVNFDNSALNYNGMTTLNELAQTVLELQTV